MERRYFEDQAKKGLAKGLQGQALYDHVFGWACMLLGDPDQVDRGRMDRETRAWLRANGQKDALKGL